MVRTPPVCSRTTSSPVHLAQPGHLAAQHRHLVARKQVGKDQETVAIELLELLGRSIPWRILLTLRQR